MHLHIQWLIWVFFFIICRKLTILTQNSRKPFIAMASIHGRNVWNLRIWNRFFHFPFHFKFLSWLHNTYQFILLNFYICQSCHKKSLGGDKFALIITINECMNDFAVSQGINYCSKWSKPQSELVNCLVGIACLQWGCLPINIQCVKKGSNQWSFPLIQPSFVKLT